MTEPDLTSILDAFSSPILVIRPVKDGSRITDFECVHFNESFKSAVHPSISKCRKFSEFKDLLNRDVAWFDLGEKAANGILIAPVVYYSELSHAWFKVQMKGADDGLIVVNLEDITEAKNRDHKLKKIAYHDVLTGLANRNQLNEEYTAFLMKAEFNSTKVGVLILNIDNMKNLNDSKGHKAGDDLILSTARTLERFDKHNVVVYRTGGDEFLVIIQNQQNADQVAQMTTAIADSLFSQFISVSGGVAIYPDDSKNEDELLRYADIAMHTAKKDGKHKIEYFKYDMVMLGRRQVGSTIKPYLYALAMQNGMTPCSTAPNVQRSYGGWTPRNGSRARYGQQVPLKWGLLTSNNWISAYLINQLGPSQFVDILHSFGLHNPDIDKNTSPVLCLGPCEVSIGEMVSAYTTFANGGVRCAPRFVTKIEDSHGNIIAQFPSRMMEVISAENSYRMIDMLRAVVEQGTGRRLKGSYGMKGQICGKTGTTNNNSDGWFMGFTPQLVNGCWVGGEDRDIHFDATSMGQGATMALPIWAYYMKLVYADKSLGYSPEATFDIPKDFKPCAAKDSLDFSGIEDVPE